MDRFDPLNAAVPGEPYRNANVGTGDEGSYPDARGFDAVMTEIVAAIAALGKVPSAASWTQLGEAIVDYVAASASFPALAADIVIDALGNLATIIGFQLRVANFTFEAADRGKLNRFYGGGITGSLPTIATLADGWHTEVQDTTGGSIISAPTAVIYVNGSNLVSSYTLSAGESGRLRKVAGAYILTTNKPPSQLTSGFYSGAVDYGTIASGTLTPTYVGGNFGIGIANGAFNLAAPTAAGNFTLIIDLTNGAAAGAVTATGYTTADLTALTTTAGDKFRYYIIKLNGSSTVRAEALQ